jgi:hypothetical protein
MRAIFRRIFPGLDCTGALYVGVSVYWGTPRSGGCMTGVGEENQACGSQITVMTMTPLPRNLPPEPPLSAGLRNLQRPRPVVPAHIICGRFRTPVAWKIRQVFRLGAVLFLTDHRACMPRGCLEGAFCIAAPPWGMCICPAHPLA